LIVLAIGFALFFIETWVANWFPFPMLHFSWRFFSNLPGDGFSYLILLLSVMAVGLAIFFIGFREKREASPRV
jgi:hypothetical protein